MSFVLGLVIGGCGGVFLMGVLSGLAAPLKENVFEIQEYCRIHDCFECPEMTQDGRCRFDAAAPMKWQLDHDEDDEQG